MSTLQPRLDAPPAPVRMTLDKIKKGTLDVPPRLLVYGVEGVGKSTFAAGAPGAIFVGPEDGTFHLDVDRFPTPDDGFSYQDVRDAIRELTTKTHSYKNLVIDTVDWLEPLIWSFICGRDKKANIEDYGYGKGYSAAYDEWRVLIADLERLRSKTRMGIILVAHSWIKKFSNPEGEDFDRYELKLHARAAGLLKEWSDAVLFCNYQTFTDTDKSHRTRGVSDGSRLLHTCRTAAYDAKNRYGLPAQLPLDWGEFDTARRAGKPADPAAIESEIRELIGSLPKARRERAEQALTRAAGDALKLSQLLDWTRGVAAATKEA
jgi:hypothetical protein